MNLVAKEYVAASRMSGECLILSRFTGAARELRDAIIVNPYDIEATGEAIAQALEWMSTRWWNECGACEHSEGTQHLLVGRHPDWGTVRTSAEWMMEGVVPQLGRLASPTRR